MKEVKELFKSLDGCKIEIRNEALSVGVSLFTKDTIVKYQENFGLNFYHTLEWNNYDGLVQRFQDIIEPIVINNNKVDFDLRDEIMTAFTDFKDTFPIYCCTVFENNVKSFKCVYQDNKLIQIDLEYINSNLTLLII